MTQENPKEYIMKPVVVEAWQIEVNNLEMVAKWCRGRVRGMSIVFPKIRDKAKLLDGQDNNHYAIVGDWVVRTNKGFVKKKDAEFNNTFAEHVKRVPVG